VRRIALFALAAGCSGGLSGCHEVIDILLSASGDPPVHVSSIAGQGRAFRGTAEGSLIGKITLRHGFVKSRIRNARFIGTFSSKLTGDAVAGDDALGPLTSARWHGRFDGIRNRRTGRIKMNGLVLATFTDETAGRACLRLGYGGKRAQNHRRGKPGTSNIVILGGEGGARTLRGTATARIRVVRGHKLSIRGSVKQRRGSPRGFPPVCRKLEKKFGLQPLAPG
jgi:hypothetical protein